MEFAYPCRQAIHGEVRHACHLSFDPLCGWCYGAGPALERLAQLDDVTLDLMPTGLFAGEGARPMDAQFAAYAWQNDERIARLTGQPFSEIYCSRVLGHAGGMFDSAPATLGLIAVRVTEPAESARRLRRCSMPAMSTDRTSSASRE